MKHMDDGREGNCHALAGMTTIFTFANTTTLYYNTAWASIATDLMHCLELLQDRNERLHFGRKTPLILIAITVQCEMFVFRTTLSLLLGGVTWVAPGAC